MMEGDEVRDVNSDPDPLMKNNISKMIGIAPYSTFKFKCEKNGSQEELGFRIPMMFKLTPDEDNVEKSNKSLLWNYIYSAGGIVIPEREHDMHAIRILNDGYFRANRLENIEIPPDTYSSLFVYRCILNKKNGIPPPDSSKYLISSSSYEKYDAMEILTRQKTWKTLSKNSDRAQSKVRTIHQWFEFVDEAIQNNQVISTSQGSIHVDLESQHDTFTQQQGNDNGVSNVSPILAEETSSRKNISSTHVKVAGEVQIVNLKNNIPLMYKLDGGGNMSTVRLEATATTQLRKDDEIRCNGNKRKNITSDGTTSSASKYPRLVPVAVAGPSSKNKISKYRKQYPAIETDDGWVDVGPNGFGSSSNPGTDSSGLEESDKESVTSNVSSRSGMSPMPESTPKELRRRFSKAEGQKILNVICKHELFQYTGGNKLWNILENANFLEGRTSQSMRNHFLKTVARKVLDGKVYEITTDDTKRFKEAKRSARETKHIKLCPDFDPTII